MNLRAPWSTLITLSAWLGCAPDDVGPEPVAGEPFAVGPCIDRGTTAGFATCVESFAPAAAASFGHDALPDIVLGAPQPPDSGGGSLDVASLGCGGSITLGFAVAAPNGPGEDLIVFENAFATGDGSFAEPAAVLVSDDGETWFAFACDAEGDEAQGCAGVTPAQAVSGDLARDPEGSGGDAFDLDEVGLDQIHWLRLTDRTREHYASDMWCQGPAGGFDLDAVARVHDP